MFSLVSTVRTGARACAQSALSAGPGTVALEGAERGFVSDASHFGAECSGTRSDLGEGRYCLPLKAAADGARVLKGV